MPKLQTLKVPNAKFICFPLENPVDCRKMEREWGGGRRGCCKQGNKYRPIGYLFVVACVLVRWASLADLENRFAVDGEQIDVPPRRLCWNAKCGEELSLNALELGIRAVIAGLNISVAGCGGVEIDIAINSSRCHDSLFIHGIHLKTQLTGLSAMANDFYVAKKYF